jgi:hypothetical protein
MARGGIAAAANDVALPSSASEDFSAVTLINQVGYIISYIFLIHWILLVAP